MNTLRKLVIGVLFLFTALMPFRATAQTIHRPDPFFDCIITNHMGEDFNYWVIDGWHERYGPYDFHDDAVNEAQELVFEGNCDSIIDRSW